MKDINSTNINNISEKRSVKKHINHVMRGILFYNIIILLVVVADMVIKTVGVMLEHPGGPEQNAAIDALLGKLISTGSSSIVAVLIGTAFLLVYYRKDSLLEPMLALGKRPSAGMFAGCICLMMLAQILFSAIAAGAEAAANQLGYSFMSSIEAATGTSKTLSMFLYAGIFGPVIEEIIYRGFLMKSLQKYGKTFAILVSAAVFGLMHGNLLQSIFAFMVGLVFGYAAMEYSIYFSILLHVLNNLLFGDVLTKLIERLPVGGQNLVYIIVVGGLAAAGCVVAFRHKKEIVSYFKRNNTQRKYYVYAFTAVWMLLFIFMEVLNMMGGMEKIS
ncbi:CAAX amino terminal protease self-immunity [Eubacteriaceae bacterium CHKCI004]|nr:CAAX amino terminal protease self-immunity [Eubacteriaceae bacterium CHKCI004]